MSTKDKALRVKESFGKESSLTKRRFFNNRITVSLPDLIEVQKDSYQWFWDKGLKELFSEINPIADFTSKDLELTITDYYLDEPKYPALIAKNKNISYEAPLRAKATLLMKKTGEVKEQEIYLGDFPIMTERGTFIINGVERVVVSQLIRSPGVFFPSKLTASGSSRLRPSSRRLALMTSVSALNSLIQTPPKPTSSKTPF